MAVGDFYTAQEARDDASSRQTVLAEVAKIENEILAQIAAGSLEATVGPGTDPTPIVTTLTASSTAFDAWDDPSNNTTSAHEVAKKQMAEVIGYFQRKGYSVSRSQEGVTSTFNWVIKW